MKEKQVAVISENKIIAMGTNDGKLTVKELKDKLSQFPDDDLVVKVDNSGGYENIFLVRKDKIVNLFGQITEVPKTAVLLE